MIEVKLKQIKSWIDCDIDTQYLDNIIRGVEIDSRQIKQDMLFVPWF